MKTRTIGLTLLVLVLLVTAGAVLSSVPTAPPLPVSACEEDQPCWNPCTMGNGVGSANGFTCRAQVGPNGTVR